jgi:predicted ABC-type ATPase
MGCLSVFLNFYGKGNPKISLCFSEKSTIFVTLVFFWLNSIDLAIQRVKIRVSEGGHNIPEDIIRRRYKTGIINLVNKYIPICDYCK